MKTLNKSKRGRAIGRRKKNEPPEIICVLDFGGSMTKVLFTSGSGCVELLCMEPEVAPLSAEAIATYERTKLGSADPKDAAYVGVGNEYYAVGYLAKVQFHANAGLSQLKYERAIPKTLAAVWVASQYLELGNKFNVAVAVLLPPGEYESASRLEERLREALMSYKTPTGENKVSLSVFDCKPEGGGIYRVALASNRTGNKFGFPVNLKTR